MEIAIIAHDGMKAEMVQFLNKHKDILIKEGILSLLLPELPGVKPKKPDLRLEKCCLGQWEVMRRLQQE